MPYFEITDLDWTLFEENYNIPRTEMVEVVNIYRHICRLFVLNSDLNLWNRISPNWENVGINCYHITNEKKWSITKINNCPILKLK